MHNTKADGIRDFGSIVCLYVDKRKNICCLSRSLLLLRQEAMHSLMEGLLCS